MSSSQVSRIQLRVPKALPPEVLAMRHRAGISRIPAACNQTDSVGPGSLVDGRLIGQNSVSG